MRLRLPRRYGRYWLERYDGISPQIIRETARTITLELDSVALADLRSDAQHYTDPTMRREYIAQGYAGLVNSADAVMRILIKIGE